MEDFNIAKDSNCTIKAADGTLFLVHKATLAANSNVWKELILSVPGDCVIPVTEDSVAIEELLRVLYFAYQNEVSTMQAVKTLAPLAEKYDLPSLKAKCDRVACKAFFTAARANVAEALAIANSARLPELQRRCEEYVLDHPLAVLDADDWWMHLSGVVLNQALSKVSLHCSSLQAAASQAKEQVEALNVELGNIRRQLLAVERDLKLERCSVLQREQEVAAGQLEAKDVELAEEKDEVQRLQSDLYQLQGKLRRAERGGYSSEWQRIDTVSDTEGSGRRRRSRSPSPRYREYKLSRSPPPPPAAGYAGGYF